MGQLCFSVDMCIVICFGVQLDLMFILDSWVLFFKPLLAWEIRFFFGYSEVLINYIVQYYIALVHDILSCFAWLSPHFCCINRSCTTLSNVCCVRVKYYFFDTTKSCLCSFACPCLQLRMEEINYILTCWHIHCRHSPTCLQVDYDYIKQGTRR